MNRSIISAQAQGLRLANLVDISTGWHVGAAFLPLYAFTCTAAALFVGSIAGRRNLLLLAQFVAVIVWWMMCAVVSVEFAISVGFADACGSALDTTLHVLRTEALKGHDKPNPNDLWHYNLSAYYLAPGGCELKNPVTSSLLAIADNCQAAYDGLLSLPKVPSNCTAFSEKDRRVDLDQAHVALGDEVRIGGGLQAGEQRGALGVGVQDDVNQPAGARRDLLGDVADPRAVGQPDRALAANGLFDDEAQQGRLASAIGADDGRPARLGLEGNLMQHDAPGQRHAQASGVQQDRVHQVDDVVHAARPR
jgi:hypothetical protein